MVSDFLIRQIYISLSKRKTSKGAWSRGMISPSHGEGRGFNSHSVHFVGFYNPESPRVVSHVT